MYIEILVLSFKDPLYILKSNQILKYHTSIFYIHKYLHLTAKYKIMFTCAQNQYPKF